MQTSMSVRLGTTTVTPMLTVLINLAALNVFVKKVSRAMVWTVSSVSDVYMYAVLRAVTTQHLIHKVCKGDSKQTRTKTKTRGTRTKSCPACRSGVLRK